MINEEFRYMVAIECVTFQQSKYIKDALDGFCMQKTSFPFIAIVIDDASTDGEQDVINNYLAANFDEKEENLAWIKDAEEGVYFFARHKLNKNCFILSLNLKKNLYKTGKKMPLVKKWFEQAKYIALCEGDDYWTDPLKLQKQVDFLEEHEDYSMCFHFVNVDSEIEKETYFFDHLTERDYPPEDFYDRWAISTCSILYRRDLLDRVYVPSKFVVYGDMYMFLLLSEVGKIRCLGFSGSTYRRHSGSMSHLCNHQMLGNISKQYRWYTSRFGYNPKLKQLSIKQEKQYLSFIINDIAYKDTWRYRFRYMCLCPKLFLSKFHLVTIFKYFLFRPCLVKKNSKKS